MNKNGFTFIELLAIIILIGLITIVAVPSIRLADKKIQQKNYDTKVELIEKAAESYADDHKDLINYSATTTYTSNGVSYPAITVTVRTLLDMGYLSKDPGLKKEDILDPRDDKSMLNKTLTVYIKNNRSYAVLNNS